MERFALQSELRGDAGKGVARKLRMAGRLPAVLYGHKEQPVGLSVSEVDIRNILRKHPDSAIVDLSVTDGSALNAIIRDVQRHPATGKLLHLDFQRISLDEKVRVEVQVHIKGVAAGVKEQGGILEHGTRTVNVMCLPTEIPDEIVVDVTGLTIHDSIGIKDIAGMYPSVEFLDDVETTLATVIPPIVEAAPAEEEAAADGAEPELIRKPAEEDGDDKDKKE
jgi:large subunit ribosomal protein L25